MLLLVFYKQLFLAFGKFLKADTTYLLTNPATLG